MGRAERASAVAVLAGNAATVWRAGRHRWYEAAMLRWWLRVVGALYLLLSVAAVLGVPIKEEGPPGVVARAAAGDPLARFAVDTWVTFGLFLGAIGVALLIASAAAERARFMVTATIALEAAGMIADVYKISRGYLASTHAPIVWLVIHSIIIATGAWSLKRRSAIG
jgi:hypothetical protein